MDDRERDVPPPPAHDNDELRSFAELVEPAGIRFLREDLARQVVYLTQRWSKSRRLEDKGRLLQALDDLGALINAAE
jgi:hypothetical protein